jgi:hypothetical protein
LSPAAARAMLHPGGAMAKKSEAGTIRRTLQFKFTLPNADSTHLLSMIKAATPFWEAFGSTRVRLLRNVDDPARFIQEIEYDAHEALELNRQRIASDPRFQAYVHTWRSLLAGAVEIDVYETVK